MAKIRKTRGSIIIFCDCGNWRHEIYPDGKEVSCESLKIGGPSAKGKAAGKPGNRGNDSLVNQLFGASIDREEEKEVSEEEASESEEE